MSERDKTFFLGCGIGAGILFVFLLGVGFLDQYKLLDPILDFLHIP